MDEQNENIAPTGERDEGSKKFLIIGVAVVIIAVAFFAFRGGSNTEEALANLDELIALDKSIEDNLWDSGSNEEEIDQALSDLKKFVKLFEKEAKSHLALAKKVDLDDQEEMQGFMERHDKIMTLVISKADCLTVGMILPSMLEDTNVKKSKQDDIQDAIVESCDISRTLDVIELERTSEVIEVADEYTESDSDVIPTGYSFVAQRPTNGKLETITLTVGEKERGTSDVVTSEPLIGKKVTGTGNVESISASMLPSINAIASLWNSQSFNAGNIEEFLEESVKEEASDIEAEYNEIVFNWRRFESITPLTSEVVFDDVSNSYRETVVGSTQHPFVMVVPVTVSYIDDNKKTAIPFYYYSETNTWGPGKGTLNAFFAIANEQNIPASYDKDTVIYNESDSCKDGWYFDRADGVAISNMGLSGYGKFFLSATNGSPNQLFVKAEGKDTVSELAGSGYNSFTADIPTSLVEHFNSSKVFSMTISEFNNKNCKANPDIKVTFFEENQKPEVVEEE